MDTGYRIVPGGAVKDPEGAKTRWWVRSNGAHEMIWGSGGICGWTLVGNSFFAPDGAQSSYFIVERGPVRQIHGPRAELPWGS